MDRHALRENQTAAAGQIGSLPPANEVCEGYVFTGVCLSTGGSPWQTPWTESSSPGQRPPIQRAPHPGQRPPLDRNPPGQRPPLDRNPLDRDAPRTETPPPWTETPPGTEDGNERVVRILLEYTISVLHFPQLFWKFTKFPWPKNIPLSNILF